MPARGIEVDEVHIVVLVDAEVVGLDVPVDKTISAPPLDTVQVLHRRSHLLGRFLGVEPFLSSRDRPKAFVQCLLVPLVVGTSDMIRVLALPPKDSRDVGMRVVAQDLRDCHFISEVSFDRKGAVARSPSAEVWSLQEHVVGREIGVWWRKEVDGRIGVLEPVDGRKSLDHDVHPVVVTTGVVRPVSLVTIKVLVCSCFLEN